MYYYWILSTQQPDSLLCHLVCVALFSLFLRPGTWSLIKVLSHWANFCCDLSCNFCLKISVAANTLEIKKLAESFSQPHALCKVESRMQRPSRPLLNRLRHVYFRGYFSKTTPKNSLATAQTQQKYSLPRFFSRLSQVAQIL